MRKLTRVTAFALAGAATLALAGCSTGLQRTHVVGMSAGAVKG